MGRSIIIIGAGAAGLQAGQRLSKSGHKVTILEANPLPGGRIHTLPAGGPQGFSITTEGGAEFIHGELPLTLALAKAAGVDLQPLHAQMVRVGADHREENFHRGWDELFRQMEILPEDIPFADFLAQQFSGEEYSALRRSVSGMAEGYDLADLRTVSTKSLLKEWVKEEDGEQEFRPIGGYRGIIEYLERECMAQGCVIHYTAPVVSVEYDPGIVVVRTAKGQVYTAEILVSTVSLGVLKEGGIVFSPELPSDHLAAIRKLGFGTVIKVLLEFDQSFWDQRKTSGETLFLISEEALPTWWTQSEDDCALITGWVAGVRREALCVLDKAEQLTAALQSLSGIFGIDVPMLRKRLRAFLILDWSEAPGVHGGYSFDTVGASETRVALSRPVEGILYFSGEALYEGDVPGTVEAAFCSGITVADKIIAQS